MTTKVLDAIYHIPCCCRTPVFPSAGAMAVALGDHHRKHGSRFRISNAVAACEDRDSQRDWLADVLFAGGPGDVLDLPTIDEDGGHGDTAQRYLCAVAALWGPSRHRQLQTVGIGRRRSVGRRHFALG